MTSWERHAGHRPAPIERRIHHTRSIPRPLLAVSLLLTACQDAKDPRPADPEKSPLAVGEGSVTLREPFGESVDRWHPVAGSWQLRSAGDDRVLVQTATDQPFPMILWKRRRFTNVDATVRLKPISGKIDASGGIVFRAQDGANYYVVRANSLEDNFRLYTVIRGERRQIASTTIERPELGTWHTLRVVAVGSHIQAHLNGRLLIDHRDETFAEGWVGLWTKADSVTEFDDVVVRGQS